MVLKLDDIALFVANWQSKDENLRHIAATLNIGLDSVVFIDDNPVERNLVRGLSPKSKCPSFRRIPPATQPLCIAPSVSKPGLSRTTIAAAPRRTSRMQSARRTRHCWQRGRLSRRS